MDYAGDDAALPYRFIIKDNPFVSGKKIGLTRKPASETKKSAVKKKKT